MEFLKFGVLYSKQGKGTLHLNPHLYYGARKAPKMKQSSAPSLKVSTEETNSTKESDALTSSFRAVSRDQYEFAFRNRTNPPPSTRYNPSTTLVSSRRDRSPVYRHHTSKAKEVSIFVPPCMTGDFPCTHGQQTEPKNPSNNLKRDKTLLSSFNQRTSKMKSRTKPTKDNNKVREFSRMKSREPFVKDTDPPHPKRFDFDFPESCVLSKNKRPRTAGFEQQLPRGQLFKTGLTLKTYDWSENSYMRRNSTLVLSFDKVPGRNGPEKDSVPESVDLQSFDSAFEKQSYVRGIHQIPRIQSKAPRDDSMYRVKELYMMNVPERQTNTCPPKYGGSESVLKVSSTTLIK